MYDEIVNILNSYDHIDKSNISSESNIRDDLKCDYLDIVYLVTDIEDSYDITMDEDRIETLKTVDQLVRYIVEKKSKK